MNLFKIIWPDKTEQELAHDGDLASLLNCHWGSTPVPATVEIHQLVGEYVQLDVPQPVIDQATATADANAVENAEKVLASGVPLDLASVEASGQNGSSTASSTEANSSTDSTSGTTSAPLSTTSATGDGTESFSSAPAAGASTQ